MSLEPASVNVTPIPVDECDCAKPLQSDNRHLLPWMNRWLERDVDSPSLMLQFLDWYSMAALYNTCSQWSSYLNRTSNSIATAEHELRLRMISKAALACRCHLLRRHLRRIQVKLTSHYDLVVMDHAKLLFQITHLEILYRQRMMSDTLITVATLLPNLRILRLDHDGSNERSVWQTRVDPSFAALVHLPNLTEFRLHQSCYFCQKSHVQELLQCKSLTYLDCGRWISDHREDMDYDRTRPRWIEECISQLHRLPNLQHIGLGPPPAFKGEGKFLHGVIQRDVWLHLAKCTSLTDLGHVCWHEDIGENWKLLTNLTHLKSFSFERDPGRYWKQELPQITPPIHMWATLIRCTSISDLKLTELILTNTELTELFSSLPLLTQLQLTRIILASLEPFTEAMHLKRLTLLHCADLDRKAFQWHVALPSMPRLRFCHIENRWPTCVEGPKDRCDNIAQLLAARFPTAEIDFTISCR